MSNLAKYICEKCEYSTNNKTNYNIHLLTPKHKMRYNAENFVVKRARAYKCKYCKKRYKHQQSLWRHSKVCPEILKMKKKEDEDDLINQLREELKMKDRIIEMKNEIIENSSKPNNFNLTIFLNEDCKNAMNIGDFINSMQLSLKDLQYSIDNGKKASISNILIKELKMLKERDRPLHCTDLSNNTLYIKSNDEWSEDTDHKVIDKSINEIDKKTKRLILMWDELHPNWMDDNDLKNEYLKMVQNNVEEMNPEEKREIIKNVSNIIKIESQ